MGRQRTHLQRSDCCVWPVSRCIWTRYGTSPDGVRARHMKVQITDLTASIRKTFQSAIAEAPLRSIGVISQRVAQCSRINRWQGRTVARVCCNLGVSKEEVIRLRSLLSCRASVERLSERACVIFTLHLILSWEIFNYELRSSRNPFLT